MDGQSNGQGSRSPAYDHVDSFTAKAHGHVPEGAVVIADPNLIFNGELKRTGLDLVLSHDGHEFVVHDYFRGDKRAAIASPDGAHLTGDIVSALTGYVQYAQAAPGADAAQVIGHVTKLTGSATAIRNGVSVILNNGDNVEKGDVVSTGSDSTLGVTFIDGTVFGLSSNARMVLNEMVYDPNGSNNSSLLSLVAGTITFVAGETAKHGDMKIDTPVATMGIRGTAVLTEINFVVPAGGGDPQPQANFQVLVEPNGTTGSYILFDKLTLLPIATVNQAGQMVQISGGNVSITNGLLSPDVQKLITDVFTLKFTDNNTNTKLTTNFTDTITQNGNIVLIKTDTGATATATFTNTATNGNGSGQGGPDKGGDRFPGAPLSRSLDLDGNVTSAFKLNEHANTTADHADTTGDTVGADTVSGRITFADQNLGDRPTVSVNLAEAPNFAYQNAGQQDVTGSLTALQKQDIAATQIHISVVADGANNNNGSAVWTYTIPDHVFDFLAAGETLTLTYMVRIDNNFSVNPETAFIPITITITGTNDKPVIATSVPTITFAGGTSIPGGPLDTEAPTSGTLTFTDVDLTDTHTVSVSKFSAALPGGTVPKAISDFLASALLVSISSGHDSTGTGTGSINWSLKDIPVYLADFIPKGEVLTLIYTVTVKDSQGATSDQTVTVTITGTDAPAVVWIATNTPGAPSGGFWKDGANWETGNAPTINDDVIVITDQLHGLTPSYPVTIDAAAYANSLTMNDFDTNAGHTAPEVINKSSLTIATTLTLGADSKFTNLTTGSISVGGKAEFSGTSVLTNAGYLTLDAGGDFTSGTSITNSGTIELFGGTLTTLTEIHNAGGTLKVDGGATLIVDATTVDGGTVTILGTLELDGTSLIENGALNNSGTVNVKGTTEFAHETVVNSSLSTIEVWANGALTIDKSSGVTNRGDVKVDATGKLIVNSATLDGGALTSGPGVTVLGDEAPQAGEITVITGVTGIGTVTNNGELDLTGNAVLSNGILKNNGTLNVSGTGNALSGETVTNAGTLEVLTGALAIGPGSTVGNSGGNVIVDAALTLAGATISGGAVKGAGSIDVTSASKIDGGATLSTSTVIVDAQLTLDGITVSGSVITDNAGIELDNTVKLQGGARIQGASADAKGEIANNGTLEIAGAATLLNDVVTNNGTVKVDGGQTLTLSSTEIDGGTLTIAGTLESTGTSAIIGANIANDGTVSVTSGVLTIDADALHTITNDDLIEVINGAGLDISGGLTIANKGGTITVDGASKLYLSDVTINDGSLDNSGNLYAVSGLNTITASVANTGTIEVQAGTLDLAGGITGAGKVIVDHDATLEFSGATGSIHIVNSGSIIGAGSDAAIHIQQDTAGSVIDNDGTIGPDAASVTSTTYAIVETGGAITINNTGHINGNISVATATFNNEAYGTWTVAGTSVFGTGSSIVNDGTIDLHDGASISAGGLGLANHNEIDSWGAASVSGTIANTGTIEVHDGHLTLFGSLSGSGSVTVDVGATLEIEGTVSQTITLAGDGAHLQIDTSTFGGSIAALSATDTIDLSTIKYGLGTSAVYVANADASTGGVLTVTDADGHTISLKLSGADYSSAHFAGSDDGSGHTLITINANDDAPAFTATGATLTAGFSELADTTGASMTYDPAPAATGSIAFTDIDLTDRPTATITHQDVTWLDHSTQLTLTPAELSALEAALLLQQTGKNNGTVGWSYSIADGTLDFLGQDQTAKVVSTITLDDHQGQKTTADVTITITGKNDAPTLAAVSTGPLTDTAANDSFPHITGTLVGSDADHGETATLHYAVLDGTTAVATLAGHYGSLTVNSNGTYDYLPDATAINALSAGSYVDTFTVQTKDAHGATGTATLTVDVTGANDAPVINVDQISVTQHSDEQVIVHGLSVTDADAAANETFTLAASTAASGSNVSPSSATGSLAHINSTLQTMTYNEGSGEPSTDKVTLTVTDGHNASDTVNLIFNLAESSNDHMRLAGTTGKDVFFGTSYQEQFVFAANSNHDTIVNFTPNQDHIDLTAVVATDIDAAWIAHHVAASPTNPADSLITIDAADTILLKGVHAANLHASDFIVHPG
ncbi:VCBS domain-containing protein [Bradyrhizobium sp. LB11.1]|uniref:VCBS domain-containing protein n=1 Tax=Bradyrhizobium sp. LB11.1 TaxID=3156326 RepID=UPI0033996CA9